MKKVSNKDLMLELKKIENNENNGKERIDITKIITTILLCICAIIIVGICVL